jgi:hypothetical protein
MHLNAEQANPLILSGIISVIILLHFDNTLSQESDGHFRILPISSFPKGKYKQNKKSSVSLFL